MNNKVAVQIKYLSGFDKKTGCREEMLAFCEGSCLKDVIDWLNGKYYFELPNAKMMLVYNNMGWLQLPEKLATKLKEKNTILLLEPLEGG